MRLKILFWLAVVLAFLGIHSPDGNLFYFFAVHLTMLTIGFALYRREKRGRATSTGVCLLQSHLALFPKPRPPSLFRRPLRLMHVSTSISLRPKLNPSTYL